MDAKTNPFSPGAGTKPPELAGRDDLILAAEIGLDRIRSGRSAKSLIFYGLRGVGKTVLLNRIRQDADNRSFVTFHLEAPEGRSLPGILAPALRAVLIKLSRGAAAKDSVTRAMRALAGFVGAFKVKYSDIEVSIDVEEELGLADSKDLDLDLSDLLSAIGMAALQKKTAVVLFVDEIQYVPESQLASLIVALHSTSQQGLPITMVAAGLPQILGQTGRAKSYAERLFQFVHVDKLTEDAARDALCIPVADAGEAISDEAVRAILDATQCYPYFLQEWGKHSWNLADRSPISKSDVEAATVEALAELDASFFRVRFDRLTPSERKYLRAMAELGPGPHRSGDIAVALGRTASGVAPTRNSLIRKGMVYSPAHGDTAFTVPLFDAFMKRTIPDLASL